MRDELDQALDEYEDLFGYCFPTFAVVYVDSNEIIRRIRQCIKDGKPYDAKFEKGKVY